MESHRDAQAGGDARRSRTWRCGRGSRRSATASTSSASPSRSSSGRGSRATASSCSSPASTIPTRVKDLIRATAFLEIKPVVTRRADRGGAARLLGREAARGLGGRLGRRRGPRGASHRPRVLPPQEGLRRHRARPAQRAPLPGPVRPAGRQLHAQPGRAPRKFERVHRRPHRRPHGDRARQQGALGPGDPRRTSPTPASSRGTSRSQGAEDLALVLRAGALPASITYLEERTVGPSLGRDSIVRGLARRPRRPGRWSSLFMLVYYKGSGINANVALRPQRRAPARRDGRVQGHADAARHRRHHPHHRHGGGLQRADLRAHPRGARARQDGAQRGRPRLPAGAVGDHRLQPDDDHLGAVPVPVRHRTDQGVRGHADDRSARSRCSPRCSSRGRSSTLLLSRRAQVTTLSI